MQIHKIMAGLLDAFTFLGNHLALDMVVLEARYFLAYHNNVVAVNGTMHWVKMLDNEFGGMAETLFKLYDITGEQDHWRYSRFACLPLLPCKKAAVDQNRCPLKL